MSKVLLVTTTDIKKYSPLNGSVDNDKFIQYIDIAQDIHLKQYIGSDLLDKLQSLLPDNIDLPLNIKYKNLLSTYIKPMLIHWSIVEILPFMAYSITNGGVFKHTPENSTTVNKTEIDFLIEKERGIAENYTKRFQDFIFYNCADFPEYSSNVDYDVKPTRVNYFGGWEI